MAFYYFVMDVARVGVGECVFRVGDLWLIRLSVFRGGVIQLGQVMVLWVGLV